MNPYLRSDPRHRLEHTVMITPESAQGFNDMGVVIQANPVNGNQKRQRYKLIKFFL